MAESESRKCGQAINLLSTLTYLLVFLKLHHLSSVRQRCSQEVKSCLLSNLSPSELTQVAVNLLRRLLSNKGLS